MPEISRTSKKMFFCEQVNTGLLPQRQKSYQMLMDSPHGTPDHNLIKNVALFNMIMASSLKEKSDDKYFSGFWAVLNSCGVKRFYMDEWTESIFRPENKNSPTNVVTITDMLSSELKKGKTTLMEAVNRVLGAKSRIMTVYDMTEQKNLVWFFMPFHIIDPVNTMKLFDKLSKTDAVDLKDSKREHFLDKEKIKIFKDFADEIVSKKQMDLFSRWHFDNFLNEIKRNKIFVEETKDSAGPADAKNGSMQDAPPLKSEIKAFARIVQLARAYSNLSSYSEEQLLGYEFFGDAPSQDNRTKALNAWRDPGKLLKEYGTYILDAEVSSKERRIIAGGLRSLAIKDISIPPEWMQEEDVTAVTPPVPTFKTELPKATVKDDGKKPFSSILNKLTGASKDTNRYMVEFKNAQNIMPIENIYYERICYLSSLLSGKEGKKTIEEMQIYFLLGSSIKEEKYASFIANINKFKFTCEMNNMNNASEKLAELLAILESKKGLR
jgi:hypothetical protein